MKNTIVTIDEFSPYIKGQLGENATEIYYNKQGYLTFNMNPSHWKKQKKNEDIYRNFMTLEENAFIARQGGNLLQKNGHSDFDLLAIGGDKKQISKINKNGKEYHVIIEKINDIFSLYFRNYSFLSYVDKRSIDEYADLIRNKNIIKPVTLKLYEFQDDNKNSCLHYGIGGTPEIVLYKFNKKLYSPEHPIAQKLIDKAKDGNFNLFKYEIVIIIELNKHVDKSMNDYYEELYSKVIKISNADALKLFLIEENKRRLEAYYANKKMLLELRRKLKIKEKILINDLKNIQRILVECKFSNIKSVTKADFKRNDDFSISQAKRLGFKINLMNVSCNDGYFNFVQEAVR